MIFGFSAIGTILGSAFTATTRTSFLHFFGFACLGSLDEPVGSFTFGSFGLALAFALLITLVALAFGFSFTGLTIISYMLFLIFLDLNAFF